MRTISSRPVGRVVRLEIGLGALYLSASLLFVPSALSGESSESKDTAQWLQFSGEARGRAEIPTALNFVTDADDGYLLTRLRLMVVVRATPWLKFTAEAQDSRATGYNPPVPGSVTDRADLRQAYADIGSQESSWSVRAGRQAIKLGKGRLVSDPDWGNVGTTFDGVRVSYNQAGRGVTAFAASVVNPQDGVFDSTDFRNMFYGAYGSLAALNERVKLEPYLLLKSNARVKNELGRTGTLDVYTTGLRSAGRWASSGDWEVEAALQRGQLAGAAVRAFAGVVVAGWGTAFGFRPHLSASYMYASGDSNPTDGIKQTFDSLYPSTHGRNGLSDRIGWANLHDPSLQADWRFGKRWRFTSGGHDFWLVTLKDALYNRSGSVLLRNPKATSRHIGWELFGTVDWKASARFSLGGGCARLYRGEFLRQSGRNSATQPYLFLAYRFGTDVEGTK